VYGRGAWLRARCRRNTSNRRTLVIPRISLTRAARFSPRSPRVKALLPVRGSGQPFSHQLLFRPAPIPPYLRRPVPRSRVVPRYYQIEQALRRLAAQSPVGAALPSEPALSAEYKVSRTTIRAAIEALAADGIVERIHGRGTFVRDGDKLAFPLDYHRRTTEPAFDEQTQHRVLVARYQLAGAQLAAQFGLEARDRVLYVRRATYRGDTPLGQGTLIAPASVVPGLGKADFKQGRFFYTLRDHGVKIARHRVIVESIIISPDVAHDLKLRPGLPGIQLTRYAFDAGGHVLARVQIITRGDMGSYVLDFTADGASAHHGAASGTALSD
jgi:GntR family transcriptional regulator